MDVLGVVVQSYSKQFKEADKALITGCGLSASHDGGCAEYVRVQSDCVIPPPNGLSLFEAMTMGTPASSSALALQHTPDNHQNRPWASSSLAVLREMSTASPSISFTTRP